MESPNSLYNNINNTSKDGFEAENIVIPSNFLISTKEIIARFPHNKRVGHYLLGRKLGEGSFAKVKEGLHTLTGQKVAIKVIDKKKAKEDAYVSKNMRREGKLLQMIIHPNIIQLYELMETENSYYLVTELCEGGDLMDYICARKFLSEACTRKFIRQIISAVDYLHRIGILHRDLKIENLLLDKNLNIKLIDFGLSNYTKSELCITQCGSPAYAAPELLAHKKYGSKVDVWSIGVNMYAMLTGNLPFTVEPFNIKSLYNKMMKNEMNPIPDHLSKSGEDLLRRLLNPDPLKRISLKEAMEHPWINEGYSNVLKPFPYPNKPTEDQVNPTILRYMNSNMEFSVSEVAENIKSNKPSSSLATYYLLLNKVKTMLMKIDPKKDKLKPRTETTKPIVKDLKQAKTAQSTLPSIPNAQSPLPRTVKTPGATNVTVSTAVSNNNVFAILRNNPNNKQDGTATTKYATKATERTVSPMPTMTNTTSSPTNIVNVHSTAVNNSNNSSSSTPANAFAGAIKSLTQKYKTMHLNTSSNNNDTSHSTTLNTTLNITNNNNSSNSSNPTPTHFNSNNSSNSNSNTNTFSYKTAYISGGGTVNTTTTAPNHQHYNLSNSIDFGMNNTSNNSSSGGEQTSTNNSDSLSSSDDKQINFKTTNLTNRNSSTNTTNSSSKTTTAQHGGSNNTTLTTGNTAEWTQMIKLTNGKSDLNNNDTNLNNSNSTSSNNDHSSPVIHLNTHSGTAGSTPSPVTTMTTTTTTTKDTLTSNNMPNVPIPISGGGVMSAGNGGTLITSRLTKSPLAKKISSPITLPPLDAGRSTPQ